MPNRNTHLLLGALAGAAGYAITRWLQGEEIKGSSLLLSAAGGALAGELPDILEPATNPNHRSHFHSVFSGGAIIYGINELASGLETIDSDTKAIFVGVGCGYLSHLLADGTTPKRLPIL